MMRNPFLRTLVATALLIGVFAACSKRVLVNGTDSNTVQMPERLKKAIASSDETKRSSLEVLLKDGDPNVRILAAENLGTIASESSIPALMGSIEDRDIFVRGASREALLRIGLPAVDVLLARLAPNSIPTRSTLAPVLVELLSRGRQQLPISDELAAAILAKTQFARCLGTLCVRRVAFPTYPALARHAGITGKVWLEFSVESGTATEIVADGHPYLSAPATEALKQWIFEDSSEKPRRYNLTVEFELIGTTEDPGDTAVDFILPNYIRTAARGSAFNAAQR